MKKNPNKWLKIAIIITLFTINTACSFESEDKIQNDSSAEIGIKNNDKTLPITQIIDGDTVEIMINGEVKRIRLFGIDTPEREECFYEESRQKAIELLGGKQVKIETDETQDEEDKYGRLIRYIYLPNQQNYSEIMIKEGYAKEYTHIYPYKYQKEFQEAENYAKENQLGIWKKGICDQ